MEHFDVYRLSKNSSLLCSQNSMLISLSTLIFLTLTFPKFTYMWFRVKRNSIPQLSPKSMRQDLNSLDSFSFSFAHLGLHVSQLQPFFFQFSISFQTKHNSWTLPQKRRSTWWLFSFEIMLEESHESLKKFVYQFLRR